VTRHLFLGDLASWATDLGSAETSTGGLDGFHALFIPGATLQFWDALSGGSQITDLLDMLDTPITEVQGPDTDPETWSMWADGSGDGSGPRRKVVATDIGDTLNLGSLTDFVPLVVRYDETGASWPARPAVAGSRTVFWLGPTAPPVDDTYMLDDVDFYFDWQP